MSKLIANEIEKEGGNPIDASSGLKIQNGAYIYGGTGTPEGSIAAPIGSLYLRTDGSTSTTLYVKESGTGNTGWVAK